MEGAAPGEIQCRQCHSGHPKGTSIATAISGSQPHCQCCAGQPAPFPAQTLPALGNAGDQMASCAAYNCSRWSPRHGKSNGPEMAQNPASSTAEGWPDMRRHQLHVCCWSTAGSWRTAGRILRPTK
uniref:Uncharacterized protein n=1 Tax=Eutreptiella gymnastica TaxID=73025 RepID=A0A7S4FWM3_9EUGL